MTRTPVGSKKHTVLLDISLVGQFRRWEVGDVSIIQAVVTLFKCYKKKRVGELKD